MENAKEMDQGARLKEVAGVFLRLGATAFGGPAAHIAMMEAEIVRRRQWVDRETFLDLLGATNLIPGPNSTELAIHLSYRRAGWWGLVVGGTCFILPAMLIVLALAYVYQRFGALPQVGWFMYGVKPVIIAIVAQALWGLTKTAVKGWGTAVAGVVALVGSALGFSEAALLLVAGAGVMLAKGARTGGLGAIAAPLWLQALGAAGEAGTTAAVPRSLTALTLFFLKVGSVLYGSGYVLLAFLQSDLVERWGWLTSQQLLDAVAVGQFTPGPVFTTATFVGYLIGGTPGAILSTVAIFLPAFVFVWLLTPLIGRIRRSPWASGFLDGVNAASLGLMAFVTLQLGRAGLMDGLTILLGLVSLALLLRFKINSAWLVLGGALVGYVSHISM